MSSLLDTLSLHVALSAPGCELGVILSDAERERLIEAWRYILANDPNKKMKTAARWALRGLGQNV
jgi:hypothetical protein